MRFLSKRDELKAQSRGLGVGGWQSSLASSRSSHVPLWVIFYLHDAGGGSKSKGREIPTFAFYTPRKVTRFPVGHSFKQKYPFLSPCEAIILFTSRSMYRGGGGGLGVGGQVAVLRKCQRNVKCPPALSSSFLPLKCSLRGRGSQPGGNVRLHLLTALNKTAAKLD